MDVEDVGIAFGLFGLIILILLVLLLPLIATIILGVFFANLLGLSGIVWWAFVIVFYLVIMGIIGMASNFKAKIYR